MIKHDPDFACISLYKLFGEPTGLGILFVRRSEITTLLHDMNAPRYFGGGSVDVVLSGDNFMVSKTQPSPLAVLSNGTSHFRGIISLSHGFDEIDRLGGMDAINRHATCLTAECARRLKKLKHGNGRPVVQIYGAWSRNDDSDKGTVIAFNCFAFDGRCIGYNEVSKLAGLHNPPIQLRTGCFCNPGACQEALGHTDDQIKKNYLVNGHVCGDDIDILDDIPTGAIRVSFGKDSLWEDMDCLILFIEKTFVNLARITNELKPVSSLTDIEAVVKELYIFPIKSCAPQRVMSWSIDNHSGKLAFDREFALVDMYGTAMRQQRYPQMTQIQPSIDLYKMTMKVSAIGYEDLIISLEHTCIQEPSEGVIQVCGNKCGGVLWGDDKCTQWFCKVLGVKCWLARRSKGTETLQNQSSKLSFANDEAILLITLNSVNTLNQILLNRGEQPVQTQHFRPNIVVTIENENTHETVWRLVLHKSNHVLYENVGDCARCSMVDIDPSTGKKGKTLQALAENNRRNGRINFGIFLHRKNISSGSEDTISEGDILHCT
jgi:molybdenum cofactor sulfurtransferase